MLLAGTMLASDVPLFQTPQTRPVYFNGREIQIRYSPGVHDFKIGPWNVFAHILHEKPRDPHPNLYIVAPGTQYKSDSAGQFDHNEIISVLPLSSEPVEWDIYYAVVLDPSLHDDFRSERQLILATQNEFSLDDGFKFDDIPGAAFLRRYVKVDSLDGLQPYRRHDGKLPRLLIVPAKMSVKALAVDNTETSANDKKEHSDSSAALAK